jgi:GMP synthase (glutamine-hydrolysing)
VVLVRHEAGPDDDRVVSHLAEAGYVADIRFPFRGDLLGEIEDNVAATVIDGGMYNAYDTDRHGFLKDEYRWIDAALTQGLPILGICQGAQMIAHHLGAFAGARGDRAEFGYYEVAPVDGAEDFLPAPLHLTQAHFHTFDLPEGAVHLASSTLFENQAFRLGANVYGFQFHPEVTRAGFQRWQAVSDLAKRSDVQSKAEQDRLAAQHDAAQAEWFHGFLDRWLPRDR